MTTGHGKLREHIEAMGNGIFLQYTEVDILMIRPLPSLHQFLDCGIMGPDGAFCVGAVTRRALGGMETRVGVEG